MQSSTKQNQVKAFTKDARDLEKQIGGLVERIMGTSNQAIINAYEQKIEVLEKKRKIAAENSRQKPKKSNTFEELFELSFQFLSSLCKIWESGRYDLQKLVLKLVFLDRLPYSKESGCLNTKKIITFQCVRRFLR